MGWPGHTLSAALDTAATAHPDRPYVITDGETLTYAEVALWSRRIARGLVARGIRPGESVAMVVANRPAFVGLVFGIARAGAIAVPVNVMLRPRELTLVLERSDSVALFTMDRFRELDYLAGLDETAPGWAAGPSPALPSLRFAALCAGGSGRAELPLLGDVERDADPDLDGELARRADRAGADEPASIFFTSGSSGEPKGVVLTHDMQLRSAYGSALTRAFEDGRRILFALPLHHVFAYVEGLLAALFAGGAAILQEAFDPVATLEGIGRHGAGEVLMVPTMSLAVVEAAAGGDHDLGTLHSAMSAASPAPARLWEELRDRLGLRQLVTAYGMTETSAATTFTLPDDPMERLVETVGRPKLGGDAATDGFGGRLVEYKVVDPFTGADLPVGSEGELAARGPIVTRGYYRAPRETAAAALPGGWMRSGDLGRIDAAGYLRLTGRSKDLYKCGGELVMPREVEALLTAHPAVAQAYVTAVPDERMGEVGWAFVVPAAGAQPTESELLEVCRAQLARFKVPVRVVFMAAEALPLTSSGKVQKFRLPELA
jgi:fatty-acyl-CoA synthase